jgi:hypothetical protein
MALMRVLQSDPEIKYYLGVMLGSATAVTAAIMEGSFQMVEGDDTQQQPENMSAVDQYVWGLKQFGAGIIPGKTFKGSGDDLFTGEGLAGNISGILKLGSAGFAGFCAMVLILKAIFSGTDLGELLSGVGEIIPL